MMFSSSQLHQLDSHPLVNFSKSSVLARICLPHYGIDLVFRLLNRYQNTFIYNKICLFGFFFIITITHRVHSQTYQANRQEFVGPFSSWVNLKTVYGAKGDGVSDDTQALQRALDELGKGGENDRQVLYLPSGTYRISATLTMAARKGISIIGESPTATKIKWAGGSGGTMFHLNGVNYARFSRITWDGSKSAGAAVAHKWDGFTGYAVTHNEHSDEVFVDVGHGIRAGIPHKMDAETSVLRCRFIRNTVAGVSIESFNALDWFIWDSYFEDCRVGVTNDPPSGGAGNFHVYQSVFKRSTYADIAIRNAGFFSIRDNYSLHSKAFFVGEFIGRNGAQLTLQQNRILDPLDQSPIRILNKGPVSLLDNTIRSRSEHTSGPVVRSEADLLTVGNIFTVANAVSCTEKWLAIDDVVQSREAVHAAEPVLVATPVKRQRKVFELTPGWTGEQIQQIVDSAAALRGQRPVLHLRPGSYSLTKSIVIPAGSDLQVIGDGFHSRFSWFGAAGEDVIRLEGGDDVVLEEFSIYGNYRQRGVGLKVQQRDQAGQQIFMQGVSVWDGQEAGVLMEGFNYTAAELHDFYHKMSPRVGVAVSNGSQMNIFGGASSNNVYSYEVTGGGSLQVQDVWYESSSSGGSKGFVQLKGTGNFILNGAKVYASASPDVTVDIDNFSGKATFLGVQMNGRFVVRGEGSQTSALAMGMQFNTVDAYSNSSAKAQAAMLNSRVFNAGSYPLANLGTADAAFVRQMLEGVRKQRPQYKAATAAGVILHRIQVAQTLIGIHLAPATRVSQSDIPSSTTNSATGKIAREYWSNISGVAVSTIPVNATPTSTSMLTSFEAPSNVADNYGQRIRGFLHPTVSGTYTFYIAGDDNCELWLSRDDTPANKVKVASVSGSTAWTSSRLWTKYSSQKSVAITLQAGRKYYIEALHKEAAGGDNLAVGWVVPNTATIAIIPGAHLSPYLPYIKTAKLSNSLPEEHMEQLLHIYPNPVFGERIWAELQGLETEELVVVCLYNNVGSLIGTWPYQADVNGMLKKEMVFPGKLPTGVYLITLKSIKRFFTQKLIVVE
jgi:hypothetical protein